jgi:hypothetical protein
MSVARHPRPYGLGASSKHLNRLTGFTPVASLEIRQYAPPSTPSNKVATHASVATRKASGATRDARRPRGFAPPRRLHLARLASVLQPAADHGVRRVARARSAEHLPKQGRRCRRDSHDAVRTLRRIPLADSRTASPRPLPFLPFATRTRATEATREHLRPEWAPIHRSRSPHIRPSTAETANWYVKRSRQP